MLRRYDQAADVATTLLKTSHYSTEADVQQSRERAATVLVQAFEEQDRCAVQAVCLPTPDASAHELLAQWRDLSSSSPCRDTETVPLLAKLYGSLLDVHISAILLWWAP